MVRTIEGAESTAGRRFAIAAARWNDFVVADLLAGALDALRRAGAEDDQIEVFRCPGSLELPGLVRRIADSGRFAGIVCLGVVIRGGTPHFDLVVRQANEGIGRIAAEGRVGIAFGVLACESLEQAQERADPKRLNRGYEAGMVAVQMADLYARIGGDR